MIQEVPKKVVYVFIDASNVWDVVKSEKRFIEYKNLKDYFLKKYTADDVVVYYYDAYPKIGTRSYDLDGKHKFFTYLKKGLRFIVRKKELKRITDHGDFVREKGNMDVEIVIDAVHTLKNYDVAVLFTGDADFLALVRYLQKGSKKVYIFSSQKNISHELKTAGDGYVELRDIPEFWGKPLLYRA